MLAEPKTNFELTIDEVEIIAKALDEYSYRDHLCTHCVSMSREIAEGFRFVQKKMQDDIDDKLRREGEP